MFSQGWLRTCREKNWKVWLEKQNSMSLNLSTFAESKQNVEFFRVKRVNTWFFIKFSFFYKLCQRNPFFQLPKPRNKIIIAHIMIFSNILVFTRNTRDTQFPIHFAYRLLNHFTQHIPSSKVYHLLFKIIIYLTLYTDILWFTDYFELTIRHLQSTQALRTMLTISQMQLVK